MQPIMKLNKFKYTALSQSKFGPRWNSTIVVIIILISDHLGSRSLSLVLIVQLTVYAISPLAARHHIRTKITKKMKLRLYNCIHMNILSIIKYCKKYIYCNYIINTMGFKNTRLISVSNENYFALKKIGLAGDSFNDVISELLQKMNNIDNNDTDRRLRESKSRIGSSLLHCNSTLFQRHQEDDLDR
jgi:predicted CopG family antitoxin